MPTTVGLPAERSIPVTDGKTVVDVFVAEPHCRVKLPSLLQVDIAGGVLRPVAIDCMATTTQGGHKTEREDDTGRTLKLDGNPAAHPSLKEQVTCSCNPRLAGSGCHLAGARASPVIKHEDDAGPSSKRIRRDEEVSSDEVRILNDLIT
jgi:hypothetical protein